MTTSISTLLFSHASSVCDADILSYLTMCLSLDTVAPCRFSSSFWKMVFCGSSDWTLSDATLAIGHSAPPSQHTEQRAWHGRLRCCLTTTCLPPVSRSVLKSHGTSRGNNTLCHSLTDKSLCVGLLSGRKEDPVEDAASAPVKRQYVHCWHPPLGPSKTSM